ncbi:MAG: MBL fold metallo-hydrolase [Bacteroidales bacterium]|jgi:glyoxylase-like metal-dependent hydrolase (beta-lactamase superfamily II)|nr:MBL fold metallo-hydrolase [Bacteroidales bacterium]
MLNIRRFPFNPFQVNTYILWDETKECAIIDPGCYGTREEDEITGFIRQNGLKPVRLINTHCHIDHIAGMAFISREYGLKPEAHPGGLGFIKHSAKAGFIYGFDDLETIEPELPLKEGDVVRFGKAELEVVETPGHADGSVCFISHADRFVITGDVLFHQSIGRSDLPTGDYDLLIRSIREKLLTLPHDYKVYSGHGPETTIGFESYSNPFLNC